MKRPVETESSSANIGMNVDPASDWREKMLAEVRTLICQTDVEIVEERKWMRPANPAGVAVWSHGGMVCTGETYKTHVKITFARGASLPDPARLFNSSMEGNVRRAIDLHEGDRINEAALKALICAAVGLNLQRKSKPKAAH